MTNNWAKIKEEFDKLGQTDLTTLDFIKIKILEVIDECIGEEKKRQFPLAKKPKDRVYDCEVVAYNQKVAELKKYKEEWLK